MNQNLKSLIKMRKFNFLAIASLLAMFAISCSSDDDFNPEPTPEPEGEEITKTGILTENEKELEKK